MKKVMMAALAVSALMGTAASASATEMVTTIEDMLREPTVTIGAGWANMEGNGSPSLLMTIKPQGGELFPWSIDGEASTDYHSVTFRSSLSPIIPGIYVGGGYLKATVSGNTVENGEYGETNSVGSMMNIGVESSVTEKGGFGIIGIVDGFDVGENAVNFNFDAGWRFGSVDGPSAGLKFLVKSPFFTQDVGLRAGYEKIKGDIDIERVTITATLTF